jgi:hypothetical protein
MPAAHLEEAMNKMMRYLIAMAAISVACGLAGYREVRYLAPTGRSSPANSPANSVIFLGTIKVTPADAPQGYMVDPMRAARLDGYAGHDLNRDRKRGDRVLEKSVGTRARANAAAIAMRASPVRASGNDLIDRSSFAAPASIRLLVLLRTLRLQF